MRVLKFEYMFPEDSMNRTFLTMSLAFSLALLSCGGGGSGGGDPLAALEGTWFGHTAAADVVSLEVDGTGSVTEYWVNGVPTPLTAAVTQAGGPAFLFDWSTGFTTRFLTDGGGENALMIDTTPPFAVENSTAFDPDPWAADDLRGTWAGYGYAYISGRWQITEPVELVVGLLTNPPLFTATLPAGTMTGVAGPVDMAHGAWDALALDGSTLDIYMTVHEEFIGVVVEPPGGAVADEDYIYWALRRQ